MKTVRLTSSVRYFKNAFDNPNGSLLSKTNNHIDGGKLYQDEFCGKVKAGMFVSLGSVVEKSYDHGLVEAVEFMYDGKKFYFLKEEISGNYRELDSVM